MSPKMLFRSLALLTTLMLTFNLSGTAFARESGTTLPDFKDFVVAVQNGQAGDLRGVYVPGIIALRVVQQPNGDAGFVSAVSGVATQFGLAAASGNIGLLAHNYLAGASFFNLAEGQSVSLVYGDGKVENFVVQSIYNYQALDPTSATSDFTDQATGKTVAANTLFDKMYTGPRHVTFQTCIALGSDLEWGRLFVVAVPATP